MYIDKIYTKLYSEKNWDGLNQLVNEIKQFAKSDYEGLNETEADIKRSLRNKLAVEGRKGHNKANEHFYDDIKARNIANHFVQNLIDNRKSKLNRDWEYYRWNPDKFDPKIVNE